MPRTRARSQNVNKMEDVLSSLRDVCRSVRREAEAYRDSRDNRLLEPLVHHTELMYRHLLLLPDVADDFLSTLRDAIGHFRNLSEDTDDSARVCVGQNRFSIFQGSVGRPRFDIAQDQLEYLLDLRFTCADIARLLGVSLRTIRRRLDEFGIAVRDRYSTMSDTELDEEVEEIKRNYPNAGIRIVTGVVNH